MAYDPATNQLVLFSSGANSTWIWNGTEGGGRPLGRNQAGRRRRRRGGGLRRGFRHAQVARGLVFENLGEAAFVAPGGEQLEGLGSGKVEARLILGTHDALPARRAARPDLNELDDFLFGAACSLCGGVWRYL